MNNKNIEELSKIINIEGIVNVTHFFENSKINQLINDSENVINKYTKSKDLISMNGEDSHINMFIVNKENIDKISDNFKTFYENPHILKLITKISKNKTIPISDDKEKYLIDCLFSPEHTYDWHFNDYGYSLVLIVRAPPINCGAMLEFIPNINNEKHERNIFNKIDDILMNNLILSRWFQTGTIYLMKSLTTLNRITPIKEGYTRISIVFAYDTEKKS